MAEPLFTDHALQDAYRALMNKGAGDGHLDESTWDRIVSEQLEPDARDAAFDHVVQCESCSKIWRGILALKSDAETQGLIAPPVIERRPAWQSPLVPLAIAATLILVAGGVWMNQRPAPAADTVRSTTPINPLEGLMMAHDTEGVPTFVWPPVQAATRYHVEVFTEDGRPVWARDAVAPPVRWPAEVPRIKGAIRWRVQAMNGNGVIARSRLIAVEIAR